MNSFPPFRKWVVVGTTSSGKSTLAERMSARLGLDFIELDALHWEAGWKEAELSDFRERVETATSSKSWVVAGNYHVVRDLIWPRAEAIIWLDYSFPVVFWRLLRRTIRRGWTQEELWNGNREKFWWHLKLWSEESLFHWLFKTYWRRKREVPALLALPEHAHLKVFHFMSPRTVDEWLATIDPASASPTS
jgi:adenylate kinase family enzyme